MFWGCREGYETLLNTDVKFEQENIANLMRMAVNYGRSIGFTGGFNFDAKNRRPSYTHEDMFHAFILGMDAFALGLLKAAKIIEDGRIDGFIAERYSSYNSGIGAKIRSSEATLEELAAYAEEMGAPKLPGSGRQEYLESIVNTVLFNA